MTEWNETLLGGLIPAVPIPFGPHGKPNMEAQEGFAQWMASQPIDGVAVWTDTGRGRNIGPEFRRAVLESWREALGPERWIVASAGASGDETHTLESAVRMSEEAKGFADFLLVYPPRSKSKNPEANTLEYHRAIGAQGIPLLITLPASCPDACNHAAIDALLGMQEVAGAVVSKSESSDDLQDFITYARMSHPSKAILAGDDRLFGYSLYRGCHGALLGLATVCPSIQRTMLDAWFLGEPARFLEYSRLVDHLAEAVYSKPEDSHVRKLLVGLAHKGVIPSEAAKDPWGPAIPEIDEELVRATIEALSEWANT